MLVDQAVRHQEISIRFYLFLGEEFQLGLQKCHIVIPGFSTIYFDSQNEIPSVSKSIAFQLSINNRTFGLPITTPFNIVSFE
jgi:hypothetical protein